MVTARAEEATAAGAASMKVDGGLTEVGEGITRAGEAAMVVVVVVTEEVVMTTDLHWVLQICKTQRVHHKIQVLSAQCLDLMI